MSFTKPSSGAKTTDRHALLWFVLAVFTSCILIYLLLNSKDSESEAEYREFVDNALIRCKFAFQDEHGFIDTPNVQELDDGNSLHFNWGGSNKPIMISGAAYSGKCVISKSDGKIEVLQIK